MDAQTADKIIEATHWPRMAAATALGVLALFLVVGTLKELREYHFIGSGVTASNTISVSGQGEVFAVPDTASFSVSVQEEAKDVKTAQDAATKKSNAIIDYLKGAGVDEKDIQTADYNVNPQYSYSQGACPQYGYCPPGKQTLTGYQVTQTLTVKVRDTNKAGDLLSGVGSRGASQVSGLSFELAPADQTAKEAEARGKAIADARTKADELARQLGVSIVRVVGFNEGGGGPVYYAKAMSMDSAAGSAATPPSPQIPTGQNKITSNVSVTYEIR